MANKNEFPKVDGDVLWADEVNDIKTDLNKALYGAAYGITATNSGGTLTNPQRITDGRIVDYANFYSNTAGDANLIIDLGELKFINSIFWIAEVNISSNFQHSFIRLEYSTDNTTYTTIDTHSTASGTTTTLLEKNLPVGKRCRYIRVRITPSLSGATHVSANIYEIGAK